ncbi:hypothetical protein FOH24_05875 [Acetobacter tropicalis]|uniref:Uncharacterized protein n=1 Tax=Acetobacter tropicalis TaxID=104102 RepID=A0A094ZWX3_9PROT|nr:hypothetical protein [Acetobacter tropicalis]KAA8390418.1 hypothetical protein FOH22_02800 [Acetobacter tropicalis]KAA8391713.1 hypothetical protein FOH24_05875 [Acetobacter tropicalis]KGB26486.1 hypothetical protein AtDm6_0112 [Acetobacter tropicalis]MBC9009999.1 hypothetical protein [Acetobacter tropicalis]MDO8173109.1 hypothetical protein [Acetobacter tropicalis]
MTEQRLTEILQIEDDHERRIELLIFRLPEKAQPAVRWMRKPQARWARLPVGVLLICGGLLSILPVLGLWMLPLGVILLSEDIAFLRRLTDRVLAWVERRKPQWLGLEAAPHS